MIPVELIAKVRRLFFAEHWKIGTIASQLGLHPDTVRSAIESHRFNSQREPGFRATLTSPYLDFIYQTLQQYPRLRATRIYEMIRARGYAGSMTQLRRVVRSLRPQKREAFLRLTTLPGEQAQADWAHFGKIRVGRAERKISCFVITLSYSRALWVEFFFDQSIENLLLGHVHAFSDWGGVPRNVLYDYVPWHIIVFMCPRGLCSRAGTSGLNIVRNSLPLEHNSYREFSQSRRD